MGTVISKCSGKVYITIKKPKKKKRTFDCTKQVDSETKTVHSKNVAPSKLLKIFVGDLVRL